MIRLYLQEKEMGILGRMILIGVEEETLHFLEYLKPTMIF
jgi:hypothetical protein